MKMKNVMMRTIQMAMAVTRTVKSRNPTIVIGVDGDTPSVSILVETGNTNPAKEKTATMEMM